MDALVLSGHLEKKHAHPPLDVEYNQQFWPLVDLLAWYYRHVDLGVLVETSAEHFLELGVPVLEAYSRQLT